MLPPPAPRPRRGKSLKNKYDRFIGEHRSSNQQQTRLGPYDKKQDEPGDGSSSIWRNTSLPMMNGRFGAGEKGGKLGGWAKNGGMAGALVGKGVKMVRQPPPLLLDLFRDGYRTISLSDTDSARRGQWHHGFESSFTRKKPSLIPAVSLPSPQNLRHTRTQSTQPVQNILGLLPSPVYQPKVSAEAFSHISIPRLERSSPILSLLYLHRGGSRIDAFSLGLLGVGPHIRAHLEGPRTPSIEEGLRESNYLCLFPSVIISLLMVSLLVIFLFRVMKLYGPITTPDP